MHASIVNSRLAGFAMAEKRAGMFIAWTTVAALADAERLANDLLERNLAVCVQVEGPVVSRYRWEGRIERAEEYRLTIKCMPATLPALEAHVGNHHPYTTPEWLVIPAGRVGEKYLSWAEANSTTPPL